MEPEKKKYKVVKIQELGRKDIQESDQPKPRKIHEAVLVGRLDSSQRDYGREKQSKSAELYCYKDTGLDQRLLSKYNNFFNAFYQPYNLHGDVLLVPDDIWLMISLFLSKYIDKNAEKLRTQFVKHQGQKELTIIQIANSVEQSLKMEKQWDYFFDQIIQQIEKNTVEGVVNALKCDFTTTDKVYETISTAIIMSSFKKYFTYGRMICCCGLENIHFAGKREDWDKIIKKTAYLERYDVDGQLKKYIKNVGAILNKFLDTFDEKPDKDWWNTIMTSQKRRVGSGSQYQTYIQGWILHFYGIYHQVEVDQIPKTSIFVPIKLVNQLTQTTKKLELISDWVSVSQVDKYTYKPDIGMCIVERERFQTPK